MTFAGLITESEVRYEQVISTGPEPLSGGETGQTDMTRTYNTANAEYRFQTIGTTSNPFELKSKAKLEVDIDAREPTELGWNSVTASARSVSGFSDTAFVDGVTGEVGGFIEFTWLVTGASSITLDPVLVSDGYVVESLSTTAILNPSDVGGGIQVFHDDQSGSTSVESFKPGVFEPQTFTVDWIAGDEFVVEFELTTISQLEIIHLDAAGFNAFVESDFSNTAVLQQIRIFDEDGTVLPNATLTSIDPNGPAYANLVGVPEPSAGLLLMLLVLISGGNRFCKRVCC